MPLIHQVMILPFRNRINSSLRPVHRIKHVIDSQFGAVAGTAVRTTLIKGVDAPVIGNVTECETGSKVNGIFLVIEGYARTAGALANAYIAVYKNQSGLIPAQNPNIIGTSTNKKFYIHQEMVMLQRVINGNPRTFFKGVIAIPRHFRRFAVLDSLIVSVFSPGVDLDVCLQCHYKEFR